MHRNEILPHDEYARLEQEGIEIPYIFEVAREGQELVFIGTEHTGDVEHQQFERIEQSWTEFVQKNPNAIALVEGRYDEVPEADTKDPEQSIIDGGEPQYVVHLARRDGVRVASPEPDRIWEANTLTDEFGEKQVAFYYFMRQANWWAQLIEAENGAQEAQEMLDKMAETYGWNSDELTVDSMLAMHQEVFGKPFDDDPKWLNDIISPATDEHFTNQLARRTGDLRDSHILGEVESYWNQGVSPFIVYGSGHAVRLEGALKRLGDENASS